MQVYRGMPIITQVPLRSATQKIKTHLVSFLSPSEEYSAAHFRKDAQKLIPKIFKKNKIPFLVGGTGLYLRALLEGLFEPGQDIQTRDEKFRKELLKEQELHGGAYMHDKLRKVDEVSAQRIHPHDLRRIVRALEVHTLTGKPMSQQMANRKGIRALYNCPIFFLNRDRQDLYERVNRRVDKMIQEGLVAEAKSLSRKRLSLTAQMALGVREMEAYLEGKLSLEEARELLKKNTRNYAKRQLSWFRHEKGVENIPVAADESPKIIAHKILRLF